MEGDVEYNIYLDRLGLDASAKCVSSECGYMCDEEDGDYDCGMGIEEGDYGMGEGLNQRTPSHPDAMLSYQQFKSRTTARQGDPRDCDPRDPRRPSQDDPDPQDNVPQDMLCQEIPQVCQEVNPQVCQEQEEMFEFEFDDI